MNRSNIDNIIEMKKTKLPAEAVLEAAEGQFEEVMLMGWDKEGKARVYTSKALNEAELGWILDGVKAKLINGDLK